MARSSQAKTGWTRGCVAALALLAGACQIPPHVTEADMPRPEADIGGLFSNRIEGHWRRPGDASCADGPIIRLEGPDLVVTYANGERVVHQIDSDAALKTETHVVNPAGGPQYVLQPEFNAASELRSFNLILENKTTGAREIWTPCEVN